jgi:transposase
MKTWVVEAYEMYIQGFSYPVLSDHIGEKESTIRHHIKKYAYQNGLVYPRLKPNYELAFNLHYNGMSITDIAKYMGVCNSTVWNYIRRFSEKNGIPKQYSYKKCQVAYSLREQGHTYKQISKMLGYHDQSNCYRAIKNYKDSLC